MATKKAVTKKAAPAGKAMAKWDERLAALANIATRTEESTGGGGQFIGTRAGQLTFNGAAIPGNKMNVVVIDHVLENALYDGPFDADNPRSPTCFAFGRDAADMAPHTDSSDPQGGPDGGCKGCPHNEFGSAEQGRGKACKNIRRLALITEDSLEEVESAQVVYIKVPVTSGKNWAGYVKQLGSTLSRPPLGVVTELSLVPDPKSQFQMRFKLSEEIDDGDAIGKLIDLGERVAKEIEFPYQPPGEEDAKPQRGKAAPRKQAGKAPPARGRKPAAKATPAPAKAAGSKGAGAPPRGRKY